MFKKKGLEFEILENKILSVADFDWFINCIDAVYVRRSEMSVNNEYAIFIQQGSEIVELYLRTTDEMLILREYEKLCEAIKAVRPEFDNSAEHFVLINYENLKDVKMVKHLQQIINLEFNNGGLTINGGAKKYNMILQKYNELNLVKEI